jgi:uncharacterized protein (TIGR03435 family)
MKRVGLSLAVLAVAWGQSPAFEVATIKPSPQLMIWSGFQTPGGGRFEASQATLKAMVAYAYDVRDFYVSGGPGWASSDRFEIVAKADANSTSAQMRAMLRTLIEERFKLAIHRETKEATMYELVVAKGGLKIGAAAGSEGFLKFGGRGQVEGQRLPMGGLANYLQTLLGQPVMDKTELKGVYNFKLAWTPDEAQAGRPGAQVVNGNAGDEIGPSIFTALQEQLGLKLETAKGSVDTVVIDHAEKPSEN